MQESFVLDHHHIEQVVIAAQCLDRIDEAGEAITKEGSYYTDRFGQPKEHPAHKTERDNKALFLRILNTGLCLDIDEPKKPGRPPNAY